MGTSTSNKGTRGNGTPLIPTWLDSDDLGITNEDQTNSSATQDQDLPAQESPKLFPPDPDRFRMPRSNFSKFISSKGKDRSSLGRAISSYITKTRGGAHKAARGMGSSRSAGSNLIGVLSDIVERGAEEALKSLNLEQLAGNPIQDIFLGLSDYICPEGGTVDVGIARDAFMETISDLLREGVVDLDKLNLEQVQTVFEIYATHAIEIRIYNDIANNIIKKPQDISGVKDIQVQLYDFIRNAVSDSLSGLKSEFDKITPDKTLGFVDKVYEQTFSLLITLSNKEAEE